MRAISHHLEHHHTDRIGWLRAAVLGANDGIVSTASLMIGVAAANSSASNIVLTGVAGLVAGAMSMAAGEFVSVNSQADAEQSDLTRESAELKTNPVAELAELRNNYITRGLTSELALQVAQQLTSHDALAAHALDELGISKNLQARPVQAALASALSFAVGAALPLVVTALVPSIGLIYWISGTAIVFLALLGLLAAQVGGSNLLTGAWRVTFWGAIAMAVTAGVGKLFGAVI